PGSKAILTKTNIQALQISAMLRTNGYKVKLMAGFEGFRVSDLYEIKCFDYKLSKDDGESGIILEASWDVACESFRRIFKDNLHFETCMALIKQFVFLNAEIQILIA